MQKHLTFHATWTPVPLFRITGFPLALTTSRIPSHYWKITKSPLSSSIKTRGESTETTSKIFAASKLDAKLLVLAAGKQMSNPFLTNSLQSQTFYLLGKDILATYYDLHNHFMRVRGIIRMELRFFDGFYSSTLENRTTCMEQGLAVLEQYLIVIHIFSYHAKGRMLQWRKKNESFLRRTQNQARSFSWSQACTYNHWLTSFNPCLSVWVQSPHACRDNRVGRKSPTRPASDITPRPPSKTGLHTLPWCPLCTPPGANHNYTLDHGKKRV